MFRSFIPFILASLGFTLILRATKMPFLEWQFSKVVTDFSSTCDGTLPSHWTTRFGEDLEARDKPSILENLNIVVRRSWVDETIDSISLSLYKSSPLLFIGVLLSISYMWWFLLQDKQNRISHIGLAIFFTIIAVFIFILLTQVVRLGGPAVGQMPYYSEIRHCRGAITFSAKLSKIYYGTLFVLLAGTLSEVGAFLLILRQFRIVVKKQEKIGRQKIIL